MKQKTVLVTGGAGFIGGNIAHALVRNGYRVVVVDDLSTGNRKAIPKEAKFVRADICNARQVQSAMKGVDAVIHCAGKISVPESFTKPEAYYDTNVAGTLNVLEAMRIHGVKQILFSSTAGVYNPSQPKPLSEKSLTYPYSPYGATKLISEELLKFYHVAHGINAVIFRYFNAFGPGDFKQRPLNVVPIFIHEILRGKPVTVHGDGKLIRDYVYIGDLTEAHLLAINLLGFHLFNLGSGKGHSVNELISALSAAFGKKIKTKKIPIPLGYPREMYADISRAIDELGWRPKAKFAEGIKNTVDFYTQQSR